jgi:hypothetical protein
MPGTYTNSLEMTAARGVAGAAFRSPRCGDNNGSVPPQTAWCSVAALRLGPEGTAPHHSTDLGLTHPGYALMPLRGSDGTDGGGGSG